MSIPVISPSDYTPSTEQEADMMSESFAMPYVGANLSDDGVATG